MKIEIRDRKVEGNDLGIWGWGQRLKLTDRKALENKAGEGQTKKKNICFKCLYSKVLYQHLYKLGCLLPK